MTADIDLTYRDPNNLNNHIQVMFDDVLAEPEGAHSMDCVWTNSAKCFNCGLNCCYKFATLFCGIFIALGWGCTFAFVSFTQIWFCTPFIRLTYILMTNMKKLYSISLNGKFILKLINGYLTLMFFSLLKLVLYHFLRLLV
jgi:hypothetical protein